MMGLGRGKNKGSGSTTASSTADISMYMLFGESGEEADFEFSADQLDGASQKTRKSAKKGNSPVINQIHEVKQEVQPDRRPLPKRISGEVDSVLARLREIGIPY